MAPMAEPRSRMSPTLRLPRMIMIPAARKSIRCEPEAMARMTGPKLANMRMRRITRVKNSSQLSPYLRISCC